MVLQGLSLTIIGMSVVFVFLTLLIAIMVLLSAIVNRFFPEKEEPKKIKSGRDNNTEIAVAIAVVKACNKS
ncbi:MAG: OadG family protein [Spirochaetia bacterium]